MICDQIKESGTIDTQPADRGLGLLYLSGNESIRCITPGSIAGNDVPTLDNRQADLRLCRGWMTIDWEADAASPKESCLV